MVLFNWTIWDSSDQQEENIYSCTCLFKTIVENLEQTN